ncbi:hypothetical protein D3C81_1178480 [compost metagenome]
MRRGPGSPIVTADQNDIGTSFGHAGGDGSDTGFRDQLHIDAGPWISILQIIDQLRQVFDRIDVMVRRRRDQADTRRRSAHFRHPRIHLAAWQLAAFARLSPLGHFDLDFVGIHQIVGRNAKAPRSNLLDRATAQIAVRVRHIARGIFAAFAGVALPADPVHRNRDRLVRFLTDRTKGHGPCLETAHDRCRRFHFFQRNFRSDRF